jgi:hypothetical protein
MSLTAETAARRVVFQHARNVTYPPPPRSQQARSADNKTRCHAVGCQKASVACCHTCKAARYCSRKCQGASWPKHKLRCATQQGLKLCSDVWLLVLSFSDMEAKIKTLPQVCRAMYRLLQEPMAWTMCVVRDLKSNQKIVWHPTPQPNFSSSKSLRQAFRQCAVLHTSVFVALGLPHVVIEDMKHVRSLTVCPRHRMDISQALCVFHKLPNIERVVQLSLRNEVLNLKCVAAFSGLTELDLTGCDLVAPGFASIAKLPLKTLRLRLAEYVKENRDDVLEASGLSLLESLETLDLSSNQAMFEDLVLAHRIAQDNAVWAVDDVTGERYVVHDPWSFGRNLTSLNLSSSLSDYHPDASWLKKLPKLILLDLSHHSGAEEYWSLHIIAGLRTLRSVNLAGASISNGMLCVLSQLPDLTELNMRHARGTTSEGFLHLANMRALSRLDLTGNMEVKDQDLLNLVCLPHLREVRLRGCPHVTSSGVAQLRALSSSSLQILYSEDL